MGRAVKTRALGLCLCQEVEKTCRRMTLSQRAELRDGEMDVWGASDTQREEGRDKENSSHLNSWIHLCLK